MAKKIEIFLFIKFVLYHAFGAAAVFAVSKYVKPGIISIIYIRSLKCS